MIRLTWFFYEWFSLRVTQLENLQNRVTLGSVKVLCFLSFFVYEIHLNNYISNIEYQILNQKTYTVVIRTSWNLKPQQAGRKASWCKFPWFESGGSSTSRREVRYSIFCLRCVLGNMRIDWFWYKQICRTKCAPNRMSPNETLTGRIWSVPERSGTGRMDLTLRLMGITASESLYCCSLSNKEAIFEIQVRKWLTYNVLWKLL